MNYIARFTFAIVDKTTDKKVRVVNVDGNKLDEAYAEVCKGLSGTQQARLSCVDAI